MKNLTSIKNLHWLVFWVVMVSMFIIISIPLCDITINSIVKNESMNTDELECKQFCKSSNQSYYFSRGGLFGADACVCGERLEMMIQNRGLCNNLLWEKEKKELK